MHTVTYHSHTLSHTMHIHCHIGSHIPKQRQTPNYVSYTHDTLFVQDKLQTLGTCFPTKFTQIESGCADSETLILSSLPLPRLVYSTNLSSLPLPRLVYSTNLSSLPLPRLVYSTFVETVGVVYGFPILINGAFLTCLYVSSHIRSHIRSHTQSLDLRCRAKITRPGFAGSSPAGPTS